MERESSKPEMAGEGNGKIAGGNQVFTISYCALVSSRNPGHCQAIVEYN